jgi:hypothetical protein
MSCLAHYRFKIAVLIVFGLFTQWVLASSQVPTTGLANGTHHEVSVAASSQPTGCDDDSAANKTHSHTGCLNCIACVAPPLVPMVQAFSAQVPTMPMYGPHETLPEVVLDGLLRPPKSYYA